MSKPFTKDEDAMLRLQRIYEEAEALLLKHGLKDWSFGFNQNKMRAGVCRFAAARVELSQGFALLNPLSECLQVVAHECAHAIAGPEARHGPAWKEACRLTGARPEATCNGRTIQMPSGAWRAVCPCCSLVYNRHKKPREGYGYHCVRCGRERGKLVFLNEERAKLA